MKAVTCFVLVVLVMCLIGTVATVLPKDSAKHALETVNAPEPTETITAISEATSLPTLAPSATPFVPSPTDTPLPSVTPTPLPTSTPLPPVFQFSIDSKVDMGSGLPVAMSITRPDGKVISSTWAKAIAYKNGDNEAEVFSPYAGTVYSHLDSSLLATWIHSGRLKRGDLFAWSLEKAVYYEKGAIVRLSEGHKLAEQLIGSQVILCQSNDPNSPAPLAVFDPNVCPGNQVRFMVSAVALVEQSHVKGYDGAAGSTVSWLSDNGFAGFDQLVPGKSWLVQTCVSKYTDQKSKKAIPDYQYNRLVLGLTLVQ